MPRKKKSDKPSVGTEESSAASVELLKARRDRKYKRDQDAASAAGSALAKRRMALLTTEEHIEMSRKGGVNFWASFSPAEKQIEMRRRAQVRKKNRAKERRKRIGID